MSAPAPELLTFPEATGRALDDALIDDPSVIVFGEDVADAEGGGVFRVTAGLSTKHGVDRVRSTPISEQAIVGCAIGAAIAGMRPVAEVMLMNFIAVAMDQVANHAAKLRYMSGGRTQVPLTIRTTTGAGDGMGAQHSDMLEAWLAHTPGLKVAIPSSPADAYGLLRACIDDDDPCVFIETTGLYLGSTVGAMPEAGTRVPLGRANVVRAGTDVTIITYGRLTLGALQAAENLAREGIDAEVIDLRTVWPLDERTALDAVARTRRAVVAHEAVQRFGVCAELSARITEELSGDLLAPVCRVGAPYSPVPFASTLEAEWTVGAERVAGAVRKLVKA